MVQAASCHHIHGICHFFCMLRLEAFVLLQSISDEIINQNGTVFQMPER